MPESYGEVVETARDYYNSDDADNFYFHIWGGEDIHIGLYKDEVEPIADASRRTVEAMAAKAGDLLGPERRVLDMGAGFGGAARYLAKTHGCTVVALNLSEKENERDRAMNREQGLADKVEVLDASYEEVPFPDASFDVVWSQDAILHSGNRDKVVAEAARVLKPGGLFVFTDIMQVDGVDQAALQPVLDRIHLTTLGSLSFYRQEAAKNGLEDAGFEDHTQQLINHYSRVHDETESRQAELEKHVSREYIERMKVGLNHWVTAGKEGRLQWGIVMFRKP